VFYEEDENNEAQMADPENEALKALYSAEHELGKELYNEELRRRAQLIGKFNAVLTIVGLFASLGLFSAKALLDLLSQYFSQCIVLYIVGVFSFIMFMFFVSWAIFLSLKAMKAFRYEATNSPREFRRQHTRENDQGEEYLDPKMTDVQIKINLAYHYGNRGEANHIINEKRSRQYNHCLKMLRFAFICALILLGMIIPMKIIKSHTYTDNTFGNATNEIPMERR